jgi:hypothetical protein
MKVHVSLNVASESGVTDPVVRFVRNLREAAYGAGDNEIKKLLSKIDPDHAQDMNIAVVGNPSLMTTEPVGFIVEDTVDDSIQVAYFGEHKKVADVKLGTDGIRAKVDGRQAYFKVLMRMPLDSF